MIALFIGRFQPFHLGHLDAIKQITEQNIIIGIGSSQYSKTEDNPYSFEERKQMIKQALEELNINYTVVAIPDIHNEENWVNHIEKIANKFDVIYTGNDVVKKLFAQKNYPVKLLKINIPISGTEIRKKMRENKKYE
jgi:nicotinamide-nucleotide adenylyltransferase